MASSTSALRSSASHIHVVGAPCPLCDQPIPNEKAQQVKARLEARERELSDAVAARLKEQFAAERVQIEANARASVEQANRENAAKLEAAKAESAKREADAVEASRQTIETLTNANVALQAESQREIAAVRNELAKREAVARADGAKAAQERIEALEQANATAQQKIADAERLKAEAEAAALDRIAAAEAAKSVAEADAKTAKEQHEATLGERLQEQREALERDKTAALSARDAKHFEEFQKLKDNFDDVQRKLEKKTADELGEGGEVDLFEGLKAHFEGDRVRRVPKGTPGADIIHEIVESGRLCGKIVYDSKKRQSWKSEYATKLCEDKMAEGAAHAVLSLMKFPADCRQLEVRDGVILANPARVLVVAEILRDAIVDSYRQRLSNEDRKKKTDELYAYITSERFHQRMDSIERQTDKLLEIDVAEQKAHRKVWETRGGALKSLQKAHGNIRADVARIIGTSDAAE
jgi:hypothetical protein